MTNIFHVKNFKLIAKIAGGAVVLILVIGLWAIIKVATHAGPAPTISITSPQNNYSLQAQTVSVEGTVSPPEASVLVNGVRVHADKIGHFSYQDPIPNEGKNQIMVIAKSRGKQATSTLTVNRIFTAEEKAAKAKADAEQQAKDQAAAAQDKAVLAKMTTSYDDIQKTTSYYDKAFPESYRESGVILYIKKPDNAKPVLYLKVQYHGDAWLFISSYIFSVDGANYTYLPGKMMRDNSDTVWEWSTDPVNDTTMPIIQAILAGKQAKVRYSGQQYYKDHPISQAEKTAMQDVMDAYGVLGK